jgi:ferritin-like protein
MASNTTHEPPDHLSADTREMHRALSSLMEELEAVDWYQQRADACADAELKTVLLHNRDEEVEHAAMLMEWIRRRSTPFDAMMRKYLFQQGPLVDLEHKP